MKDKIVDDYRLIEKIGTGGMGSIFKAESISSGEKVALKTLHHQFSQNKHLKDRLLEEAKILSQLKGHPNIAEFKGFFESDGVSYLAMEYIDGLDLNEYIQQVQGPVTDRETFSIFRQILAACEYAHQKGIVHRDIKPSNIMISKTKRVKLLDFGIAKAIYASTQDQLTKTGTQIGTVIYMSPEQVKCTEITPQSDIYSLGINLFETIAGKPPYDQDKLTGFDIQTRIVREALPPPSSVYPHVKPGLEGVVRKATEKDPAKRYASCKDMFIDLKAVIVENNPGPYANQKRKSQNLRKWSLIGGIVALLTFGGILTRNVVLNGRMNDHLEAGKDAFKINQFDLAIQEFREAIEYDCPEANYYLGECYFNGDGVEEDFDKAFSLTLKAYNEGFKMAAWRIGNSYELGEGVSEIPDSANFYFEEGLPALKEMSQEGDLEAKANLGYMYVLGRGVTKAPITAIRYFDEAAREGYFPAMTWAMSLYANGVKDDEGEVLVAIDKERARKYAEKLQDTDYPDPNLYLGLYYLAGEAGLDEDINQAKIHFRKASELGNVDSQVYLGLIHTKDSEFEEANVMFEKAAAQGSGLAQLYLGRAYLYGRGKTKNYPKAFNLFLEAGESEQYEASYHLGEMKYIGYKGVSKNWEEAESFLTLYTLTGLISEIEQPFAYVMLGDIAKRNGDYDGAFSNYEIAYKREVPYGYIELAYMYRKGKGTTQNLTQSKRLYDECLAKNFSKFYNNKCYCGLREIYVNACNAETYKNTPYYKSLYKTYSKYNRLCN